MAGRNPRGKRPPKAEPQEAPAGPVVLDGGTGRRSVPQDEQPAEHVGPVVLQGLAAQEKDAT